MEWYVPLIQIDPVSLSTRLQAAIHSQWKEKSSSIPLLESQAPLSTGALLPEWQVNPPFDRLYGGSAKTRSTDSSGMASMRAIQSPR